MDKSKFTVKSEHTIKISSADLRKILIEVLELPSDVKVDYDTVERSDFRDQHCWTETVGVKITYTN